jgi:tRNA(Ile2) C34 agmatinyltransferase TiaS
MPDLIGVLSAIGMVAIWLVVFLAVLWVTSKVDMWLNAPLCPHCGVKAKYLILGGVAGVFECPECKRRAWRANVHSKWIIR